jgi:ABC-2 type transport system permease protein
MTTITLPSPSQRLSPFRLIRSELLKLSSTTTWWWFAGGTLVWTAIALAFNIWTAYLVFDEPEIFGDPESMGLADPLYHGGNVYTSGQFLGLMFVMLLGIVMVTSEHFHQTVTFTYLTTPHRTKVITNKLITAVLLGALFGVITTGISVAVGAIYFSGQEYGLMLGEWNVQRAILLNLLAYVVWAIFGVAIGTLITSQLAATIIAAVLYLVGTQLASLLFFLLAAWLDNETILEWQVVIPSIASQVMTLGGDDIPGTPSWWVGALILLGYAAVAGVVGVLITRRRDIS